jgi:hypothetical protein
MTDKDTDVHDERHPPNIPVDLTDLQAQPGAFVLQPSPPMRLVAAVADLAEEAGRVFNLAKEVNSCDPRWLAIAKTDFEKAFMALRRAAYNNQHSPF